jgi:hypothetical protein
MQTLIRKPLANLAMAEYRAWVALRADNKVPPAKALQVAGPADGPNAPDK